MIPAAFDYLRAHTTDEAFALPAAAWGRGPCAGRRAEPHSGHAVSTRASRRPGRHQLAERSELPAHQRSGAGDRRDRARQRHRARAVDRRAPLEPHPRRVARGRRSGRAPDGHGRRQPVPQRSGRRLDGGRARLSRRPSSFAARPATAPRPDRRVPRRQLRDGGRGRRDGAGARSFRCPTIAPPARTRKSSARSATSPPLRRPCRCR